MEPSTASGSTVGRFDVRSPAPGFADLVENARGAVVGVRALHAVESDGPDATTEAAQRSGSGVLIEDGPGLRHVLTALHVVDGARDIAVSVPDRGVFLATCIGSDATTDVALLELVEATDVADWPTIPLAEHENVRPGDWVVVVGSPMGFSHSVTAGIVGFVGRHLDHDQFQLTTEHLQISAPSAPGSSGGPVLGTDGTLIGLTTRAGALGANMTFAVPARSLRRVLAAIHNDPDGLARRGWVGLRLLERTADVGGGVVVTGVLFGGPAYRAGLRPGDLVESICGEPVRDVLSLHERLTWSRPGTTLSLAVARDGESRDVALVVGDPSEVARWSAETGAAGRDGLADGQVRRGG
jgi:S1-C subfamily serine protease